MTNQEKIRNKTLNQLITFGTKEFGLELHDYNISEEDWNNSPLTVLITRISARMDEIRMMLDTPNPETTATERLAKSRGLSPSHYNAYLNIMRAAREYHNIIYMRVRNWHVCPWCNRYVTEDHICQ